MSFKIPLNDAAKLVQDYVKELALDQAHPEVPNILGGTIKIEEIVTLLGREDFFSSKSEYFKGLVAWFCWRHASNPHYSEFFLAFDNHTKIDLTRPLDMGPLELKLARPYELFRYDKVRDKNIEEVLRNHCKGRSEGSYPCIIDRGYWSPGETGTAFQLIDSFKKNGPKNSSGFSYNKVPFGLFEDRYSSDMKDFLTNQPKTLTEIRYYFGFDENKENKIRVILMGVDENGCNIVPDTPGDVIPGEAIILQKSWPPS